MKKQGRRLLALVLAAACISTSVFSYASEIQDDEEAAEYVYEEEAEQPAQTEPLSDLADEVEYPAEEPASQQDPGQEAAAAADFSYSVPGEEAAEEPASQYGPDQTESNGSALAEEMMPEEEPGTAISTFDTLYFVNPVYEGILSEADLISAEEDWTALPYEEYYADSLAEAGEQLRYEMEDRETFFTIRYFYPDTFLDNESLTELICELRDTALTHTGVSTEGDYLLWQYGGFEVSVYAEEDEEGLYLDLTFTVTYFTTAEQERVLSGIIQNICSELDLEDKNDYDRVCAIYDYVCASVSPVSETGSTQFTAYGALTDSLAASEGFAVLIYRMMLEAGIDCRVIAGNAGNGRGAWDIVCLDDVYYNLDASWDAGSETYSYFLLPDEDFEGHARYSDYADESFYAAYPMALTPYAERAQDLEVIAETEPEPETETETEDDLPEFDTMYFVNPVYEGIISESDLVRADESGDAISTLSSSTYATSIEEAGEQLRLAMENREVPFTIKYIYPGTSISNSQLTDLVWDLWDVALEHTGVSTEGDYLRWQYGGWAMSTAVSRGSAGMYLDMKFTVTFYTTYEEEQELTNRLQSVYSELNLGCKSDYDRVCAIYDYICSNITYDYDNIYNSTYFKQYSAYGALINGTAVCQGYAVLLYRMLLEAGVDCRVITGEGNGDAHAWNIVCLNGKYYNVDSTWDAGRRNYSYFLLPDSQFSNHAKSADYAGSAFTRAYPMATSAYDASADDSGSHHTPGEWVTVKEATCTEDGKREKTCSVCGEVVEEEAIPALGHDYSISDTTEPTCETDGHVVLVCGRCEHSYVSEVLPATGHRYTKDITLPTCTEGGYTDFTCSVCGDTYEGDHTDPLGHDYEEVIIAESTCTEEGRIDRVCTRCRAEYVSEYTDALGHDYQNGVCTRCGHVEETEETEHIHSHHETERAEAACGQGGFITYICECGDEDVEVIPATGEHEYVQVKAEESTCDRHGSVVYICMSCHDTYEEELPRTEHEFVADDPTDPACTEDGKVVYTCRYCGYSYEEVLPADGHEPVQAEDGSWICARCGEAVTPPETEASDTEPMETEPETESEELIPEPMGLYDITEAEITGINEHYAYTGEDVVPDLTVTYNGTVLTEGVDYVLNYAHDVEIGFASVAVIGIGDYFGEVTYHYTIEIMIDIPVTKEWREDADAYGHRPDSVEVELLSSGEDTGIGLTLGEFNDWTDTFTGLPKYKNGSEVEYTIVELSGEALQYYTPEIGYQDDGSITIVNEQEYFPVDEEIIPDEENRDSWEKNESVEEYRPIEIEMSTYLPFIDAEELRNGSFVMRFHGSLDDELILDEVETDFAVYAAGEQIDPQYYTVIPGDETGDGCAFHVEVDLTKLYRDGVIREEHLTGETEIMLFFSADLEGEELEGTYASTVWYEVVNGEDLQYTSDEDAVYVYTYGIGIRKVDGGELSGDDYEDAALAGAILGLYYDKDCTEPVTRNGEDYTGVSGEDGLVVFHGLAEGTYYLKELSAPDGYVLSDEILEAVLDETLNEKDYTYNSVFENSPEEMESETETETETKPESETEPESETGTESESETENESEIESETESESEPVPESESELENESETGSETEPPASDTEKTEPTTEGETEETEVESETEETEPQTAEPSSEPEKTSIDSIAVLGIRILYEYDGSEVTPAVVVMLDGDTLIEGEDYTVTYFNNKEIGTATVEITGIGDYEGTVTREFEIAESVESSGRGGDISDAVISGVKPEYAYTGDPIEPEVYVVYDGELLAEGTDYELEYLHNTDAGTALVLVYGAGDFTGAAYATFDIVDDTKSDTRIDISGAEVEGLESVYEYTGEKIRPEIKVLLDIGELEPGVDYEVIYEGNEQVGTATVYIIGVGDYKGSIERLFEIVVEAEPEPESETDEAPAESDSGDQDNGDGGESFTEEEAAAAPAESSETAAGPTVTKKVTGFPANGSAYVEGEKIQYEITVANNTNGMIRDLDVRDALTGEHWKISILAVGEKTTFETEYTVTKDDALAGRVLNVATASGISFNGITVSGSGTAQAEAEIAAGSGEETVETGDHTPIELPTAAMIAAAVLILIGIAYRRRSLSEE